MMPSKIKPLAAFQRGTMHHIGGRPIGPDKIEIRGGEPFYLMAQVTHHGQGLEKDLRQQHC